MPGFLNAVVAGHFCLDIIPNFENLSQQQFGALFKPGRLVQIGPAKFSGGGCVSNTGLALQHLGISTRLIARLGDDPFGQILKELIASRDPNLVEGLLLEPQEVTSYTLIISNSVTDRLFLHCTGANDTFNAGDIDYQVVAQAALFHLGYPPVLRQMYLDGGSHLREVMQRAKATLVTTSMDMSLPDRAAEAGSVDWHSIYQAVLPYVDIFLPSLEELLYTLRNDLYAQMCSKGEIADQVTPKLLEDLSSELMDMGVKMVLIKMGPRGMYLRTAPESVLKLMGRAKPVGEKSWANCERWMPAYKVSVVGTTGSGDAAIAGFLSALLRRRSLDEALGMGAAVGACNVEAADSISGLRTWDATRERMRNGWEQLSPGVDSPGWNWDDTKKMWVGPLEK